ncbi:hypothetical protein A2757_00185 [Candidatus Giovannonibacteria bacterium RIFCSPHIGHO2_01_FULL_48_47]|nr:MAG: hypothetical protein A2757_00185 [Candidatus Giovannonibacteria bacterium RIFCSPHIGHO2_01_FULL_48_47]OGF68909.1 MAG: hypothetical protein A3D61_03180 [Candidatus Giovannonibacteria bacterium RIFCSPHIGHO2_02_FULL_48_15]OGF88539.1 MAG: hypothetical protein A3B26_00110 [Candidatus Giovannonibacteria bacterium RIFCSPLOWO2_01_FULL_48_47]OGF95493.1 MAG: hypothetical protein A2433_01690 [Candidatus Giovannonibacteria bacterium RIFOXYC1_FULL_48_8]OGF96424.1 MAG: hypothetical protein A2613_02600
MKGKRNKPDVQEFSIRLMDNILALYQELASKTYEHGGYKSFHIFDPKPRHIHKASVRDRLLHHAIYRKLYTFFDRTFITDSFSCRKNRGTHKALNGFKAFGQKVSRNNTKICWVLKGDIRKFFQNIDHEVLMNTLSQHIPDKNILWLLKKVIESFSPGLPLGNLTSQLFVNIYMNEFDQFVKHKLKVKYYIRYADDFVILSEDKSELHNLIPKIRDFFQDTLRLELHPDKVFIKTLASGVDFLGWVHFPDNRVLRTATKRRMIKRIQDNLNPQTLNSYLGFLKHGNTYKLRKEIY